MVVATGTVVVTRVVTRVVGAEVVTTLVCAAMLLAATPAVSRPATIPAASKGFLRPNEARGNPSLFQRYVDVGEGGASSIAASTLAARSGCGTEGLAEAIIIAGATSSFRRRSHWSHDSTWRAIRLRNRGEKSDDPPTTADSSGQPFPPPRTMTRATTERSNRSIARASIFGSWSSDTPRAPARSRPTRSWRIRNSRTARSSSAKPAVAACTNSVSSRDSAKPPLVRASGFAVS
jgi:hypothetical protein